MSKVSPEKILIIGPAWVGDMVMAQSLLILLKQQHPEASIDMLAPAWSKPIIDRMPEVRKAIEMPLGHGHIGLKARWILGKSLTCEHYSWAIILPNSWKSALAPWFAGIARRTAWKGEMRYGLVNDLRHLDKQVLPLMVQRFVALAVDATGDVAQELSVQEYPRPSLSTDSENTGSLLKVFGLTANKPVLVLCPGAEFGPSKQWPASYFQSIAKDMITKGWQVWILGSKGDQAIAEEISADSTGIVNLCGETTLGNAIDLMALADTVVSNDSGLMHIAAALDKPLVALYGSTSPDFTPPLSKNATALSVPIDCGPCFKRECPLDHRCMNNLKPEQVMKAING